MKPYAEAFYKSTTWRNVRTAYAKSKGYLCERCLSLGQYKHGDIVHHKIYITPLNISDPNVTLNFDNLELLCRDCHAAEHFNKQPKRYKVNDDGSISIF